MLTLQKIAAPANVKVVCRFRPINERQKALGASLAHELLDQKTVAIKTPEIKDLKDSLKFSFDKIFDTSTQQQEVYNYAASSIVDSVIEGFNGTIFAYGQTASGKTHTMEGDVGQLLTVESGIIPRMVQHVFNAINSSTENIEFRIKVSLVELYMEKLRDLIDSNKSDLKIRSDKKRGIFIEDLTETYISSPEEVYKMIGKARNNRAIASTNMNQRSSRSHMLFIITISQNNLEDLSAKTGRLYLVDLAGSQKIGKTGAEGKTLDQAKKINTSLTALGKVINALTDGKSTHIPYRDSKLTRVLQQSLGGNSKTTLIVTCSPHPNNIAETISSLRFGISAKKIKNKPKINKQMTVAELQNLLQKAEKELAQKDNYIIQLKNHIVMDLKQKAAPEYQADKSILNLQNEENDLMNELERQLQMERNLHLVQEEEINSLKIKCDQISAQKQDLERQIQSIKVEESARIQKHELQKKDEIQKAVFFKVPESMDKKQLIEELCKITTDENVINFISNSTTALGVDTEHKNLLEQYEEERQKRKSVEDHMSKYEKNMQKKLLQLENNICQLTHTYYDLVVVQQRYKVDNIFLKKKLDEKDLMIRSLKEKIKDLEDQNRELEEQWNEDDILRSIKENRKFNKEIQQSSQKFDDILEKKELLNTSVTTTHNSKVVKVLKGGQK